MVVAGSRSLLAFVAELSLLQWAFVAELALLQPASVRGTAREKPAASHSAVGIALHFFVDIVQLVPLFVEWLDIVVVLADVDVLLVPFVVRHASTEHSLLLVLLLFSFPATSSTTVVLPLLWAHFAGELALLQEVSVGPEEVAAVAEEAAGLITPRKLQSLVPKKQVAEAHAAAPPHLGLAVVPSLPLQDDSLVPMRHLHGLHKVPR